MVLLIDNYDSFSYNLYQAVGTIQPDVQVIRNDTHTVGEIADLQPSHIILSPGPGRPKDAGICEALVIELAGKMPILGICLGHQAICEAFGAVISYAKTLVHGKRGTVHVANGSPVFYSLPPVLEGGRYHSLSVKRDTLPDELLIIAEAEDGEVMGVKHRDYDIYGLQFHPESILTPQGNRIIQNFLQTGGQCNG